MGIWPGWLRLIPTFCGASKGSHEHCQTSKGVGMLNHLGIPNLESHG